MKFYLPSFFLVVVTTTSFLMTPGVVFGQVIGSVCNLCGDDDLVLGDDASSDCESVQSDIDDGTIPSSFAQNNCDEIQDAADDECDCRPRFTPEPTPSPTIVESPSPTSESEEETPSPTSESEEETPSPTSEEDEESEDEESEDDVPTAAPSENLYNQIDALTTRVETLEGELVEMRSFLNEAIAIALSTNRTDTGESEDGESEDGIETRPNFGRNP